MDPTVFPVLAYSLTSDSRSLVELRDIALYQLRPLLSTISGVAKIEVLGGAQREYQAIVNPARLDSYGLALSDVAKALSAANVIRPWVAWKIITSFISPCPTRRLMSLEQIRAHDPSFRSRAVWFDSETLRRSAKGQRRNGCA